MPYRRRVTNLAASGGPCTFSVRVVVDPGGHYRTWYGCRRWRLSAWRNTCRRLR